MGGPEEQRLAADAVAAALPVGTRFHVTGASGWLGRVTLDLLERAVEPTPLDRVVVAYASRERAVSLRSGTRVVARPLHELEARVTSTDHIVHLAFRTREQAANGAAAYVLDNVAITTQVLAAIESGVAGVFQASSGAVYAAVGGLETNVVANPYGALKHVEELAITAAARGAAASCCIARIFAMSGPYMTKPERYALGDLIRQVRTGNGVTLQSAGDVYRSYAAAEDIVALGLLSLLRAPQGTFERFDTGGEVVELGDLVGRIATVLRGATVNVSRPAGSRTENRYVGRGDQMSKLAERHRLRLQTLTEQIRQTAADLPDG